MSVLASCGLHNGTFRPGPTTLTHDARIFYRDQDDIQGPTCGVDDLAIWRLIYGPGATLSYTSDAESQQKTSAAANLSRLMGGQNVGGSIGEKQ